MSPFSYIAKYPSVCEACGDRILAGVHTVTKVDSAWIHARCAEQAGRSVIVGEPAS